MTIKMQLLDRYPWNLSPKNAIALQKKLAGRVIRESGSGIRDIETVAGVDTHYRAGVAAAAAVVMRLSDLATVNQATAVLKAEFPYIPGLLTFREGPPILAALKKLTTPPDLLIFDGQGIAHPRRCGLASHIGLLLDKPAIGCAKTRLVGQYKVPGRDKGSYSHLLDGNEIIGAVVRTRSEVKPVFVSTGYRINLADSVDIVLRCCSRYRLPETTRRADRLARNALAS